MDTFEELVYEAHKAKGWTWVHDEPLWNTWSLEKFGMPSCKLHYVCSPDGSQLLKCRGSYRHIIAHCS